MATTINALLELMKDQNASDLHLIPGAYPHLRRNGALVPAMECETLTDGDTERLVNEMLTESQRERFRAENNLDFSFGVASVARFRVNVYRQRGSVAAAIRLVPIAIPTFTQLGLPDSVGKLAERPQGLVLVTGATGTGKSTTLAAMIDKINRERALHIMSIEDPIEYLHPHRKSIVSQREVLSDTASFTAALRSILREDPDVILIGEMRDAETMQTAMTLAETGHLTLGTLHTNSCVQTISRIIDLFPSHQQTQIAAQLSFVLEGVLSQALLPRADGKGRALALEIMLPTAAIRNLIREKTLHQLYSAMQTGGRLGMQTMNQALARLVRKGLVTRDEALHRTTLPEELLGLLR